MSSNPDLSRRVELPLLQVGRRNHKSCRWGCGDACYQEPPNRSDNETFTEVVERALSRRAFLAAGGVGALVIGPRPARPPPTRSRRSAPTGRTQPGAGWPSPPSPPTPSTTWSWPTATPTGS
jgi:hypothetical protein